MSSSRVLILLSATCLWGCDGWAIFEQGDPIDKTTPYRLRLLSTESCALPAHLSPKNVTIVSYRVRLEGNLSSKVPANYFYASLLTTDGERYLSSFYGCEPLLAGEPLGPRESTEGFVNFSIPPSKIPEKLVYAPQLLQLSEAASTTELKLIGTPSTEVARPGSTFEDP